MSYSIIKMQFTSQARFGIRNLEDTFKICHSDTLFSAIYIETLNFYGLEVAEKLKNDFMIGNIKISSAMPYFYDEYEEEYKLFLPKPILYVERQEKDNKSNEKKSLKKILKEIEYIEASDLENYISDIKSNNTNDISIYSNKMIEKNLDIKVNMENEQSNPYSIVSNIYMNKLYNDGLEIEGKSGLYFIVYYSEQEKYDFIKKIMNSLQYTGIGGKRNIGYGKFIIDNNFTISNDEEIIYDLIKKADTSKYKMLLSLLSPTMEELKKIDNDNIFYSLIKRSGFVYSQTYSDTNLKKKDIYMFEEGSCLDKLYIGDIKDVSKNGKHAVHKYGMGMYVGLDF